MDMTELHLSLLSLRELQIDQLYIYAEESRMCELLEIVDLTSFPWFIVEFKLSNAI